MSYKGVFVDDDQDEAYAYALLLSTPGEEGLCLETLPVTEVADLAADLFDKAPDLVALDFRLDEKLERITAKQAFKGSSLAQLLRDKVICAPLKDFPIVLISAEDKFEHWYRPDSTAHNLFDRTYVKEKVTEDKEKIRQELVALCNGYKQLTSVWCEGDRLSVFGLREDERKVVDIQELRYMLADAAAPHIAARIILRTIIDRTGILFSDTDIAARLGIAETSITKVTQLLIDEGILYNGIFGAGWRRWWGHRFDEWAESIFGRRPTGLTGSERVSVLNKKTGLDCTPAKSRWTGSSDERFAFACASCNQPTEIRHSLAAYDPLAPRFGQHRRICWDCLQTDRYLRAHLRVDAVDENLLQEVMRNERGSDGEQA
ncbi:MAG: hypothetical protein FDZ72_04835 [Betaproteobacteria bacterium]|nr:MAG: hypothetical protein FDZ72_04835 [Betaproteobacteria bacterium]